MLQYWQVEQTDLEDPWVVLIRALPFYISEHFSCELDTSLKSRTSKGPIQRSFY